MKLESLLITITAYYECIVLMYVALSIRVRILQLGNNVVSVYGIFFIKEANCPFLYIAVFKHG